MKAMPHIPPGVKQAAAGTSQKIRFAISNDRTQRRSALGNFSMNSSILNDYRYFSCTIVSF
jgi:hypothetical protein